MQYPVNDCCKHGLRWKKFNASLEAVKISVADLILHIKYFILQLSHDSSGRILSQWSRKCRYTTLTSHFKP